MADEVHVLSVGGYIGESTRSEVEYALKVGKVVKFVDQRKDGDELVHLSDTQPERQYVVKEPPPLTVEQRRDIGDMVR
jgi:hypothetical protein